MLVTEKFKVLYDFRHEKNKNKNNLLVFSEKLPNRRRIKSAHIVIITAVLLISRQIKQVSRYQCTIILSYHHYQSTIINVINVTAADFRHFFFFSVYLWHGGFFFRWLLGEGDGRRCWWLLRWRRGVCGKSSKFGAGVLQVARWIISCCRTGWTGACRSGSGMFRSTHCECGHRTAATASERPAPPSLTAGSGTGCRTHTAACSWKLPGSPGWSTRR